jgi:hypothetical protein
VGVADVVESDPWDSDFGGDPFEGLGYRVRMDGFAFGAGEYPVRLIRFPQPPVLPAAIRHAMSTLMVVGSRSIVRLELEVLPLDSRSS